MFKNNLIVKLLIVFLFAVGLSSHAISAFKTSRIGGTKGLVTTPTKDLIASLNTKLSAFDNSTLNSLLTSSSSTWLTNADIKDLNLDLSSFGGYPLDVHELAYLTHKLATAINAGTLTLGTSQASLQDAITDNVLNTCSSTTACNQSSADWVHGQVSEDNFTTTSMVNLITPSLLDDLISGDSDYVAGYTSKVLNAKSSVSISDVRSDPFFQAIANPSGTTLPSASEIMNAINRIAGFVEAADDSNITSGEYSTAQSVVNAFLDNSDNGNFTSANFLSCYNNTETARSGGANTCNKTSAQWATNSSQLTYFAEAKQTLTDNNTLTQAQLTNTGLTISNIGTPIPTWKLEYLGSIFDDNASLVSSWQSKIDSFDNSTAALWKVAQIAGGVSGHPTSDLTLDILNKTAMTDNATTTADVTLATLQGDITNSSLTTSSSGSDIDAWVVSAAGYGSGVTLASISTAVTNGWAKADWKTASGSNGWTNSSADNTTFGSCKTSTDSSTGGSGSCTSSKTGWSAILAAINAASDNSSSISKSQIDNILSSAGTTAHTYFDSSNSVMVDYVNQCISGTSNPGAAVSDCVSNTVGSNADFKKKIKAFQIGKIIAQNSGSYTSSSLTSQLLQQAGVPSNSKNVIDGNYCGSSGTSSCLTALKTALLASDLDASATPAQVTAKVNALMKTEMETVANNTTISGSNITSGCTSSVTLGLPATCGHPQWTCSLQTGPSGWTINSSNELVVPASYSGSGSVTVKVRMSLGIYTPSYNKDVNKTYDVKAAVTGATNGYKTYSQGTNENPWSAINSCTSKGGSLATKAEVSSSGLSYQTLHIFMPGNGQDPNNRTSGNWQYWPSAGGSSNVTCTDDGGSTFGRQMYGPANGNSPIWWHCGSGWNATHYYTCKDLPSC